MSKRNLHAVFTTSFLTQALLLIAVCERKAGTPFKEDYVSPATLDGDWLAFRTAMLEQAVQHEFPKQKQSRTVPLLEDKEELWESHEQAWIWPKNSSYEVGKVFKVASSSSDILLNETYVWCRTI